MNENNSTVKGDPQSNLARWGIYALVLLIVFLLGFIPMWLQKRQVSQELETTQKQLRKTEIKGSLTTAIVEARRGEYETARQEISETFTRLQSEIDNDQTGAYTKEERDKMKGLLADRDSIITMLAQRDPAAGERLTALYSGYLRAIGQAPLPTTSPAQTALPNQTP